MKVLLLLLICLGGWISTAAGQVAPRTSTMPSVPMTGSAGVQTQLRALHYGDVRELRRGPDGQWTGKAMQNGVEKQVTISPRGVVTAR